MDIETIDKQLELVRWRLVNLELPVMANVADEAVKELGKLRAKLAAMETNDHSEAMLGKPPRITEQDAREIAHSALSFWRNTVNLTLDVWLKDHAPALLNKLNADRENVSDVSPTQEQWSYYQTLLKQNGFDGITDLLAKYHKLVEQVPAVAVPEGWKLVPLEPTTMMAEAMEFEAAGFDFAEPYWQNILAAVTGQPMLSAPPHSQQSADQLDGKYENVCVKCERIFIGAKFDRECDACPDPCQSNEIKGE